MPKCDKVTKDGRIEEVRRLLIAGAGISEIEQHATRSSWGVSLRQVQRYITAANNKLAQGSRISMRAFVGRQMQQLNHLYSRGYKDGKYDISLQALKGQVKLMELAEAFQEKGEKQVRQVVGRETSVPLEERIKRYLEAEHKGDETSQKLIEGTGRILQLAFYDFQLGILLLKQFDLQITNQQLADLAQLLFAQRLLATTGDGEVFGQARFAASFLSYRFNAWEVAWNKFLANHGLTPSLVRDRHVQDPIHRSMRKAICESAPSEEELKMLMLSEYQTEIPFQTSDEICEELEKDLAKYLVD